MTSTELCLVTMVARARAHLQHIGFSSGELEPPHPAFIALRRLTCIWTQDNVWQPVGDRVVLWLEFLHSRSAQRAWLAPDDDLMAFVRTAEGVDLWQIRCDNAHMTCVGQRAGHVVEPTISVETSSASLRDSLHDALAEDVDAVRRKELMLATSILQAPNDGSDLSDVAWPYFVLPEPLYDVAARRLFAAAAIVSGSAPLMSEATASALAKATLDSIIAAVNAPVSA
jgi:hypothetical protein